MHACVSACLRTRLFPSLCVCLHASDVYMSGACVRTHKCRSTCLASCGLKIYSGLNTVGSYQFPYSAPSSALYWKVSSFVSLLLLTDVTHLPFVSSGLAVAVKRVPRLGADAAMVTRVGGAPAEKNERYVAINKHTDSNR